MSGAGKKYVKLEQAGHFITGALVMFKGIDKLSADGKFPFAILFIVIGTLILAGTFFHTQFEKYIRNFKGFVFMLEAIVVALVGYLYWKDGKHFIHYACWLAAIFLIAAAIMQFKKKGSI